mmetsp:Transcript_3028/g.6712  ORF Transcript_3028/g.6712 Transcript_3028/m.6712 type:complete len:91 (+) Transcript_3028:1287-1559(+)
MILLRPFGCQYHKALSHDAVSGEMMLDAHPYKYRYEFEGLCMCILSKISQRPTDMRWTNGEEGLTHLFLSYLPGGSSQCCNTQTSTDPGI